MQTAGHNESSFTLNVFHVARMCRLGTRWNGSVQHLRISHPIWNPAPLGDTLGRDVIQAILLSKRKTNDCKSRSTILGVRESCNRKAEMENETVDKTNLTAQEEVHMHGATTVSSV
jgi:hypothetical protein